MTVCGSCRRRVDPNRSFCQTCGSSVFIDSNDPSAVPHFDPAPSSLTNDDTHRPVPVRKGRQRPDVAKRTALAKKTAASTAQATAGCVAALIRLGIFLAIVYYGGRWLLTVPEIASLKDALLQGEVSDDTVRTAFDGLRRRAGRIFGDTSETSAIPSLTTETTRDVVRAPAESPVPFGPDDTPPPGVYLPGNGVTMPRILRQASPAYTASARRARIEGPVILRAIVETDGTVSNIEVVQSLDRTSGLDAAALVALRQWRFAPGEREGQPVRVLIRVTMNFALSAATADNR